MELDKYLAVAMLCYCKSKIEEFTVLYGTLGGEKLEAAYKELLENRFVSAISNLP